MFCFVIANVTRNCKQDRSVYWPNYEAAYGKNSQLIALLLRVMFQACLETCLETYLVVVQLLKLIETCLGRKIAISLSSIKNEQKILILYEI